jgi:ATP-dependent Clp protease ATP-binding subunit ClpA
MDEGLITSSNGKKADCRNSIIVLTSNLGAADNERNSIGFSQFEKSGEDDLAVKDYFKPEFRNRLDGIVKFNKLAIENIKKIVLKLVGEINDLLQDKKVTVTLTDKAVDYIIQQGYDSKMGARPLARKITELIKVPLSKKLLFENITNSFIEVDFAEEITFNVTEKQLEIYPLEAVDENGFIILDQFEPNATVR